MSFFRKPQQPTPPQQPIYIPPTVPYVSPETAQVIQALQRGQTSQVTPFKPSVRKGKL